MDIEDQIFHLSGPPKLAYVDWNNADHGRMVVASLVQCVYVLERNRQKEGEPALPWCETFGFHLKHELADEDGSIFGAIFQCEPLTPSCYHSAGGPRSVVAFRGTLLKKQSWRQDMRLDFQVILNRYHSSPRCQAAIWKVEDLVETAGDSREVWLAGHSLGSALALQAGKHMAKKGVYLESLLFNPPYPSFPTEKIKSKTVKRACHLIKSGFRAGMAVFKQSPEQRKQSASSFAAMSPWVPQLFVNKKDDICSGYIGYFEYLEWMRQNGLGDFANFASQYSVLSMSMSENGHR